MSRRWCPTPRCEGQRWGPNLATLTRLGVGLGHPTPDHPIYAPVAESVYAPDLGSGGREDLSRVRPCEFDPRQGHQEVYLLHSRGGSFGAPRRASNDTSTCRGRSGRR